MRVYPRGNRRIGMPEPLRNHSQRHTAQMQRRPTGVPGIVQPYRPGLYQGTYEQALKDALKPDPRLWPVETGWPTDPVEYQKLVDASPCAQAANRRANAMEHGETIEVSAPGRGSPPAGIPWLEDDSVRTIMVASDDTVTSTSTATAELS
jgi:hypothetical protein